MASYEDIIKLFTIDKKLFSTLDISRYLEISNKRNLENLIKKLLKEGILVSLEKGKYYLAEKRPSTFEIAQFLYNPSYISFETALNYHGVLDQFPFEITSVTTKKRTEKNIEGKTYSYTKIDKSLYTGYYKENGYLIACKEKALFDEVYMIKMGLKSESLLGNLDLKHFDRNKIQEYLKLVSTLKAKGIQVILKKHL